MHRFSFIQLRRFSMLSQEQCRARTIEITKLLSEGKLSEVKTNFNQSIQGLNVLGLSNILTQLRRKNDQDMINATLKELQVTQFDLIRSVSTLAALSKYIKYNPELTLKIIDMINTSADQCTCREIADFITGIKYFQIPTLNKINLIEKFASAIEGKVNEFTSVDRVNILIGISQILSPKVLDIARLLMQTSDKKCLKEVSACCCFLSFSPLEEFEYMFDKCEELAMESQEISKLLIQIVHSFSKANKGSKKFHDLLIQTFYSMARRLDIQSRGVAYQSFFKLPTLSRENYERLCQMYEADKHGLPVKHLNTIEFFKEKFLNLV